MKLQNSPRKQIILVCIVLAVLTLVAYVPVRHHEFITFDDNKYVTENPYVLMGITWESFCWAFTRYHSGNWHPLTWLSHMLDVQCFGLNPSGHHLTNLWFHISNTILLFLLLRSMTGAVWRSFFVAAAFALHPLHVESVAWIAERKDVLSTFFALLTIAFYLSFLRRGGTSRYLLMLFVFCLSLMAKSMYVTLPFLLLILDWWPLDRMRRERQPKKHTPKTVQLAQADIPAVPISRLIAEKIPLFILAIISCVITYVVQQRSGSMILTQTQIIALNSRIYNALVSYVVYLGKMFWPVDLAILYPFPLSGLSSWWKPVAALVLLVFLSALFIYHRHKRKYLLAGWLWYLGTLVPVIGLVQIGLQEWADRYTYFPSIGIFVMLSWAIVELLPKRRSCRIVLAVVTVLLTAAMLIGTRKQLHYWRNSLTLYTRALAVTRDNYIIYNNLGVVHAKQNQLEEAINNFRQALRILPSFLEAHNNLGLALKKQGFLDEAESHFLQALKIDPDNARVYFNLGNLHVLQKKYDEAIACYRQGLRIKPDDFQALYRLGVVLLNIKQDQPDEAIDCFRRALRINPSYIDKYSNLGIIMHKQNRPAQAIPIFRMVLQYQPDSVDILNYLAWILAATPDSQLRNPSEAVELANRACELTNYNDPYIMDTLAVAYAAANQFDRAVETAQAALALAEESNLTNLAQKIRQRLKLFRTGQAYYESPSVEENQTFLKSIVY